VALLDAAPSGSFVVEALVAGRDATALAIQARRLGARLAVVADPAAYGVLREALAGSGIETAAGPEAVVEAAARPADWTMAAIVGSAGLRSTLAALQRGGTLALANKESLVCAGEIVLAAAGRSGARLLPVDSEHNAIFQALDARDPAMIEKIVLTASGGPCRMMDLAEMRAVTPEIAVRHPIWKMGAKISVDSATMMNKGLEIIEAHFLFAMPEDRIDVLVHPQSVIHSMVEYVDGSVLAQLGTPDMRTPIAFALGWPERIEAPAARLDLISAGSLTFEPPDPVRFPALRLARHALQSSGGAPTILNAANEVAVQGFLEGRIGFLDIEAVVEETLAKLPHSRLDNLDTVRHIDMEARREAGTIMARRSDKT